MAKKSRLRKTGNDEEAIGDAIVGEKPREESIVDEEEAGSTVVDKENVEMPLDNTPERLEESIKEKAVAEVNSWARITEEEQKREKSSYAAVVEGNQASPGWGLKFVEPQSKEGKVVISRSEFDAGSMEWSNTLVGYVIGRKPNFMEMKKFAQNQWRMELPRFNLLGNGVCLFTFKTEEQKLGVLNRGWTFFGYPLVLKQWTPELDLENMQVNRIPVWIRLPKLHLSLWNPVSLGKIASAVGIPITTDSLTANRERLDFARVLVEMEVKEELPTDILVEVEGETLFQSVEFEWRPQKCSKCSKYGHTNAQCRVMPQQVWVAKAPTESKAADGGNLVEKPGSSTLQNTSQSKAAEKKSNQVQEITKKGVQNKLVPPKPTVLSKTPGSKERGKKVNEESSKQGGSVITLKSPGVVVVQHEMESTQKEGGATEFDNQGMQVAGGGKTKAKRK